MKTNSIVARNFLALGSGESISRLIAFGVTIYLARVLGVEGYGVVAFATGITLYLSKLADFAIEVIGTKEIANDPGSIVILASAITSLRLSFAALLTCSAILVVMFFFTGSERTIISLYFLTLIPIAANIKWVHLGMENAQPIGLSRIASETLALVIVLCLLRNSNDLWVAPFAQITGEFCFATLLILVLRRLNYKMILCWNLAVAIPIFIQALPLLGQIMLELLIYNSDLVFLRLFHNTRSVGYYSAAYMLICFLANVGFMYGMSLLPTLTRLGARTIQEKTLYQTAIAHVYVICIPISICVCILASHFIKLGFGESYKNSIPVLQILIWCIPISLLRIVPWAALVARGRQKLLLKAMSYSAITNIVLNTLLIPRFNIFGAATATVITEFLSGILMFLYAAKQELPFVPLHRFWRATIASLFMTTVLLIFRQSNLLVNLTIGGSVYCLSLIVFGAIRFQKGKSPTLHV